MSAPFGFAPLWMAVLADTGATVIVTLNGLRLSRVGRAVRDRSSRIHGDRLTLAARYWRRRFCTSAFRSWSC